MNAAVPRLGDIVLIPGPEPDAAGRFRVIEAYPTGADHVRLTGWYLDTEWLTEQTLHLPADAILPTE